ncbi:MAG: hypothetical protein E7353_03095 [Clostridiales bacterium]|nr:hypothetical protein [Clostridiales bacterium]
MKKIITSVFVALTILVSLFCVSCSKPTPKVIKESDTYFVINVTDNVESGTTLYDYMVTLRSDGEIDFTDADGMITSLNGISNKSDWSEAWMIYTTDEDNSNTAWGLVEYNGKTYGSAAFGAEQLVIKKGESYIWLYQSF